MTRVVRRSLIVACAWLALACQRGGKPDSAEGGTKNLVESAKPKPAAPRPSSSVAVAIPAAPNAPRSERERAVLAVLRGERQTIGLPVIATDNGGRVDPKLRDALAPRKQTVTASPPGPHPEL